MADEKILEASLRKGDAFVKIESDIQVSFDSMYKSDVERLKDEGHNLFNANEDAIV